MSYRDDQNLVERIGERIESLTSFIERTIDLFKGEWLGQIGLVILLTFTLVALFAPLLAPHDPGDIQRDDEGSLLRLESPNADEEIYLGTTHQGRDILSQLLYGTRTSLIVGIFAAFIAVFIGTNVGLIAGYFGGSVDDALMRLTDLAYGVPFLPFILILVFILGAGLVNIILAIGLIQWRGIARVIRAQTLSHKERPYVESARSIGAGDVRIIYRHILPNVMPLVFLYGAFGVSWAVIGEASISFLGFGDPQLYSWGQMMFEAYNADVIRHAWWMVLPPGFLIMLFVMSAFFIGRALEKVTNPELEKG